MTDGIPFCVDGRLIGENGTGVMSYAQGLVAALEVLGHRPLILTDAYRGIAEVARTRPRRERWRRWLDTRRDRPVGVVRTSDGLVGRDVFRRAQRHFREHGTLLRVRAPGAAGVMHWTYPVPIEIEGWANLYTVHDAIPLTDPGLTPIDPARHQRLLTAIAARATLLLTVSNDAAARISAAAGIAPALLVNVGVGLPAARPSGTLPDGLLPGGFFLFCGTVEPRKNLARLAAAWRASRTTTQLVIAGPDGWCAETIAPELERTGIVRLPYLPRENLAALIANARALLFPSLAEGFGLPIAEALAAGTPVLTSRGGATEETAGGAALLVAPTDTDAIAEGIRRLDSEADLRARLAAAGLVRARDFSIDRFAARLAAVYRREIVNRASRS